MGSLSNRKWPAERAERAETPPKNPPAGFINDIKRLRPAGLGRFGERSMGGNPREPAENPVSDGYPCIQCRGHGSCCNAVRMRPPVETGLKSTWSFPSATQAG